ncbi:tat protein [Simian immunodeficiency virus]|uniref:Protein Tat n=1 Tax=Simian immunodeficiency virus TaxID=11723 RepID=K4MWL0_SIV|nr:tat protein [Simian immunodeficiency virus]
METRSREPESSLRYSSERSSSTSEVDVPTQESVTQEEEILWQLYRPLEMCCNSCYCKRCCYHCQLCFLRKGLGVCYDRPRRRTPKKVKTNTLFTSDKSISTRTRNSQPEKE